MMDGLQLHQRKVLYTCFRKDYIRENSTSVGTLSCFTERYTACCNDHKCRHVPAIVFGLAQNFVGSNNINLLQPKSGRFGTRLDGGNDTDSPWSTNIHTMLRWISLCIYFLRLFLRFLLYYLNPFYQTTWILIFIYFCLQSVGALDFPQRRRYFPQIRIQL